MKFSLKCSLLVISVLIISTILAPAQEFVWGKAFNTTYGGGWNLAQASSVAVGNNDNVFVCGVFGGELNVDGIKLKNNNTIGGDGYIAKLDSSGNTVWARTLGAASFCSSLLEVAIDTVGHAYAVGYFRDTLYMENATLACGPQYWCGVLVKYNEQGDLLWYKHFPRRPAHRLKTDNNGNAYIMGVNESEGPGIRWGTWIAKFNRNGEQIFYQDIAKPSNSNSFSGERISIDPEENVYISGRVGMQALIGDISYSNTTSGFLLVKCAPTGVPAWVRVVEDGIPYGGSISPAATIANDRFGNTYYFTHNNMLSLVKYDPEGNRLWTKRDPKINIGITGISIDEEGNLLTTGCFSGDFTLGQARFTGSYGRTVFIAKFNTNGECLWALHGSDQMNEIAYSLARSRQTGALFIGGVLRDPAPKFGKIDLSAPTSWSRAFLSWDRAFVLKVNVNSKPVEPNVGVDPTVQLNIGEDTTICKGDTIGIYANGFLRYEWSTGSTEPILNITEPGLYILKAYDKQGGAHVDSIQVYRCFVKLMIPNVITPNSDACNDYFVIEGLDLTKANTLLIFNRWGKKVYSDFSYQNNWNGSDLPPGTYFYELVNGADGRSYKGWIQIIR